MAADHLTDAQRRNGEAILQPGRGWGYRIYVVTDAGLTLAPAGSIGCVAALHSLVVQADR
jgi:hypothetical protein